MKIKLEADWGNGPATIETDLYTAVAWERKFKRKVGDGQDMGIEDLAFLFWEQAKRTDGLTVPIAFDDFLKKLLSIGAGDAEKPRPT